MKKIIAIALSLVLALSIVPCAFAADTYVVPDVYMENHDKYTEVELSELDILQNQIAGYETTDESLPDFDIYLFRFDGGIDKAIREEAEIFGVNVFKNSGPDEDECWAYDSMEFYDDQWYFCKNFMFELPNGTYQEICYYEKVNKIDLDGSNHLYLPKSYTNGERVDPSQDYVLASYHVNMDNTSEIHDAYAVETTFAAGMTPEDIILKLISDFGLDFELATISGETYYIAYGKAALPEGEKYIKIYLHGSEAGTSGIQFWYNSESNGFDTAIMSAFNF